MPRRVNRGPRWRVPPLLLALLVCIPLTCRRTEDRRDTTAPPPLVIAYKSTVASLDPMTENSGGYSNPEVDRLIERSAETMQPKHRLELLEQTMKLVMQDLPYIPLHVENNVAASLAEVEWQNRPDEFIYVQNVRFPHVTPDEPHP